MTLALPRRGRRHPARRGCHARSPCRPDARHRHRAPPPTARPDHAGHRRPARAGVRRHRRPVPRPDPRALQRKLEVIERGTDLVLAAHFTTDRAGPDRDYTRDRALRAPRRVTFRLVKGPVPHVVEHYELRASATGTTAFEYRGELGTDLWALGAWWGAVVAPSWERTVTSSLNGIRTEAERRAQPPVASVNAREGHGRLGFSGANGRRDPFTFGSGGARILRAESTALGGALVWGARGLHPGPSIARDEHEPATRRVSGPRPGSSAHLCYVAALRRDRAMLHRLGVAGGRRVRAHRRALDRSAAGCRLCDSADHAARACRRAQRVAQAPGGRSDRGGPRIASG